MDCSYLIIIFFWPTDCTVSCLLHIYRNTNKNKVTSKMIELFYNERMRVQSDVRDMKLAQLISCLRKQSNIHIIYSLRAMMRRVC